MEREVKVPGEWVTPGQPAVLPEAQRRQTGDTTDRQMAEAGDRQMGRRGHRPLPPGSASCNAPDLSPADTQSLLGGRGWPSAGFVPTLFLGPSS